MAPLADLDTLRLRLGGPVDRDARHAHAVHRAAGGELAAPLPFRLRAAGAQGDARLRRIQLVPLPKEQPFELGSCSSAFVAGFCARVNEIPLDRKSVV